MEVDGKNGLPARVSESLDEGVREVERPKSDEEEEILKLLREHRRVAQSQTICEVPTVKVAFWDSPTEGEQESESTKPMDTPGGNVGNPESHQEAQQEQRQEPAGQQPGEQQQQQQPGEHQEPAQEQPEQPPEPEVHPFFMNENRMDDDERAELQTRIATVILAAKLLRYRAEGVPEEDLELIIIPHTAGGNFISRGAWFGTFVMLTVLVLFLLQMQIMVAFSPQPADIRFDEVMYELLDIRRFESHVQQCHKYKSMQETISSNPFSTDGECNLGVLHIPALSLLRDTDLHPQSNQKMRLREGLNLTWRMPCQTHNRALVRHGECSASEETGTCTMEDTICFRGVHDNIVPRMEVLETLKFARELIADGNDHFDVYLASKLEQKLPGVVEKLRALLADVYSLHQIEPFAFRILAAGPMDGYGVDRNDPYLNQSTYVSWVRSSKVQNEKANPSIPWPFRWEPVRDQCLLLSDMEADPNFSIYTSVFLTTGAGFDFRGGTTLFVDDDDSTLGPYRRSKIQRGLVIDASRGRVVVSTGGLENKRCRLPLREGVRIELQVWWDSSSSG